jgi:IMP dehydrogenase
MRIRDNEGLTFDDVLLIPKRSAIVSRSAVNTQARLTRRITLNIPIISANMDTVTESAMAIAMARAGGMGAIHRFMTIERQAAEVSRVKRAESFVVESPATITPTATIGEARQAMDASGIGGFLVMTDECQLVGLITRRDVLLAPDASATVQEVMTPRERLVTAPVGISMEEARRLLHQHRLEKLPLLGADGCVAGLITSQDIVKLEKHPHATKDGKGRLRVAAAIGVRPSDLQRAEVCAAAGVDVLVVDIAHGHSEHAINIVRALKRDFDVQVIAGNVATAQGVRDLAEAGADAVKVGVGSGSICTTRIVTGFGVPQLTAIMDCAQAAHELDVPLIADGGIRNGGDLTKALAAGADTAMVGSLLAGTEESPGASIVRDGRRYKVVRGMASLSANVERRAIEKGGDAPADALEWEQVVPEGVEAVVPYRGDAGDILHQLVGGLRSGLSYAGATCIAELQQNAEFIRITPGGVRESGAHDVEQLF